MSSFPLIANEQMRSAKASRNKAVIPRCSAKGSQTSLGLTSQSVHKTPKCVAYTQRTLDNDVLHVKNFSISREMIEQFSILDNEELIPVNVDRNYVFHRKMFHSKSSNEINQNKEGFKPNDSNVLSKQHYNINISNSHKYRTILQINPFLFIYINT